MGKHNLPIVNFKDDYFVDYSSSELNSDFLDIYIASVAKFHFTNGTGHSMTGKLFKKPIFQTIIRNYSTFLEPYFPFTCTLPIKYYNKNEKRYLSFKEIFTEEKKQSNSDNNLWHNLNKNGIFACKPSQKEILDYSNEILSIYEHEHDETPKDIELQNKFWNLYIETKVNYWKFNIKLDEIYLKISPSFLKKNQWMLE